MGATPLTKPRPSSTRTVRRDKRPLAANAKVWKGGLAACAAGFYGPATGAAGEVVVGRFYENKDNTAGTDGAVTCDIHFFRERQLFLLDNDTGAPVVAAGRETLCSILDDHTATLFSPDTGSGAIVYDVTSEGVWAELPYPSAPADAGLPSLQAGTTTLVAGTKTVTGVKLTATSRIIVTMKDPGAGAITGLGALDAPAASRNTSTGQFVINAIDDSKAVIGTAVCTVDYLIIG